MELPELAQLFARLREEGPWRPGADDIAALRQRLEARLDLELGDEAFVRGLAANPTLEGPPCDDGLDEIGLAAAAAAGDRRAQKTLHDDYLSVVDEALAHMHLDSALASDIKQVVLEKLLIAAPGEPTRLQTYAGQGKLRGLIKVVAVRAGLSELRKARREVAMPDAGADIFEHAPATVDPELAFIKQRYRAEFKAAFEDAIEELSERERNLLRLHLLRGVTLDALAEIYGVHRATVVRWLARARERVMTTTRDHLGQRLDIGRSQIETVMKWIGGGLDASVSRVLRTRQ